MSAGIDAVSRDDYCWLRVRIFGRKDDQSPYPVEAELDDGSWYAGELILGEEELTELYALDTQVREYGIKLGRLLFSGQILTAFTLANGRAREKGNGRLRVQIWISPECSELQALMWERIFVELNGQRVSIASAEVTPFSRFTRLSKAEPQAIVERPLRLLIAVANPLSLPAGYAPIEVEREVENIASAVAGVSDLVVTILPGRTGISKTLRRNLKAKRLTIEDGPITPEKLQVQLASHHILHYLGHGIFQRNMKSPAKALRSGTSYLLLEDLQGDFQQVSDTEIVARLAAFKDVPRLIFLAACDTAKRDPEDPHPFVGLGPKLVEAGFPAVVAMQDKVPMDLAQKLTHFFYRNLLQHGLIDQALNESRKFLVDEKLSDWAIPVLFMRTPAGRLFAPNPVRAALRAIAAAPPFQPRWQYRHLALEAVLLTGGQQRGLNWEHVAQQTQARVDLWKQTLEILKPEKNEIICLAITGDRGTGRSTHLRRLVRHTAEESLNHDGRVQVLPLYLDLNLPRRRSGGNMDFTSILMEGLRAYWPALSKDEMAALLEEKDPKRKLRIIIDNLEDLPEAQHQQVLEELRKNIVKYFHHHQFVVALGHGGDATQLLPITHLLDVQLLSRRKIQQFLRDDMKSGERPDFEGAPDANAAEIGEKLANALEKTQLFDLASHPWLLVRIVERAQEEMARISADEVWPPSRALLLKEVIEDKVHQIPRARGLQARALETMYTLARDLQFSRRTSLPLQEAIPIMTSVRGGREYELEEMLEQLIRVDLMAISGNESVRFLYQPLQSYCCAHALLNELPHDNAQRFWERITSSLGGINQVRWWFETLVLLCGLLPNPDELLEQIIYSESFAETEKVFLTARCLLESERVREYRKIRGSTATETLADQIRDSLLWLLQQRHTAAAQRLNDEVSKTLRGLLQSYHESKSNQKKSIGQDSGQLLDALHHLLERVQIIGSSYVADRVMEALIWRGSSVNEPRSYQRLRAIEELGRLRRPEVVAYLARVAMERTRVSWGKEMKFEYGGVRQSAGRSLRRMMPEFEEDLRNIDPALADVIEPWKNRDIDELTIMLRKPKRQYTLEKIKEGVPAMAAFALGDIQTERARRILYDTFLDRQTSPDTRWAIADALTMLDPDEVMREVISKLIPTLEELKDEKFQITSTQNARWHELQIYIIGQLRNSEPRARKFVEKFLDDPRASFALKGRAILALGYLNVQERREDFEEVALGNFDIINLDPKQRKRADVYLRIKALQALAEVGNRETLRRLRSQHKDWPSEVERVFYVTSEEINWRLSA
jgi:hypothetical protein